MSEPWDSDLDAIMDEAIRANNLRGHYEGPLRKAIEHAVVGSPGTELRILLAKAWQAGFTAGSTTARAGEPPEDYAAWLHRRGYAVTPGEIDDAYSANPRWA